MCQMIPIQLHQTCDILPPIFSFLFSVSTHFFFSFFSMVSSKKKIICQPNTHVQHIMLGNVPDSDMIHQTRSCCPKAYTLHTHKNGAARGKKQNETNGNYILRTYISPEASSMLLAQLSVIKFLNRSTTQICMSVRIYLRVCYMPNIWINTGIHGMNTKTYWEKKSQSNGPQTHIQSHSIGHSRRI